MASLRRVVLALALIAFGAGALISTTAAATTKTTPWSSLGRLRPTLVQPAGWGSPIAAQPSSSTFGWCTHTGVEVVSSNGGVTLVSDRSVVPMLRRDHLLLQNWNERVGASCQDVALDPRHPKTVYASFYASQGGSIPPLYDVALVTSNLGRTWRFVPPPRGYSLIDFSGFVERPNGVDMVYERSIFFPLKAGQSATLVAATSRTGGRSWTDIWLDCTTSSTCVIFGPQAPQGACGMSEWQQSVLVTNSGAVPTPSRWHPAGEVPAVSQCGNQQLIATTSGDEVLIDRSRANALLYTRNGIIWTKVLLPKIDGLPVGGQVDFLGQTMTLAANGDLIAVSGTPLATSETLEILTPGATTWCAASVALPSATKKNPVSAIQSNDARLVIAFYTPIRTSQGKDESAITVPLSALSCHT